MRRSPRRLPPLGRALLAALFVSSGSAEAQGTGGPALATLSLVEPQVEQKGAAASWRQAVEGQPLRIGEQLRVGPTGLARLEMPWMVLTVSPGSTVLFPDEFLLSAVLEAGRAVVDSEEREVLKVVTSEAEVRGQGRAVVRREDGRTLVSCLAGSFLVEGGGGAVRLARGEGTVVPSGRPPSSPQPTPDPPPEESLRPGPDPLYVVPGEAVELRWEAPAPAFQIEILPVGSPYVLIQRDVGPPPARLTIPWNGAFRWRVASRSGRGVEGLPSEEGRICVEIVE